MSTATTTSTDAAALASRFHALSDEKRLRILEILHDGEHCVCDLTAALDVAQSLLSFHLKTLKDAGLVVDRRAGRWVHYSLVPDALAELETVLADWRQEAAAVPTGPHCCG